MLQARRLAILIYLYFSFVNIPAVCAELPEVLVALRTAFEANRAACPHGTIRFEHSVGSSPDIVAAKTGNWSERSSTEGIYIFDPPHFRYEVVHSLENMVSKRRKIGEGRWSTSLSSTRVMTDGVSTLLDLITVSKDGKSLQYNPRLLSGPDIFFKKIIIPLELGNPSSSIYQLNRVVENAIEKPSLWKFISLDENAEVNGYNLIHFVIEYEGHRWSFWSDIETGGIPRRLEISDNTGAIIQTVIYDNIRLVYESFYYPFKEIIYFNDKLTKEVKVVSFDVEPRPTKSAFELRFDKPYPLVNDTVGLRYAPRDVWNLTKLPSASSPQARRINIASPPSPAPELPGETNSDLSRFIPLIILLVLTLVGFTIFYIYRKG